MSKKYSISVILPAYNEGENIERIIKNSFSFLCRQDVFKEYEIIVVDDHSIDNTAEILRNLTNKIATLKVVTHFENLGYGKALMTGVKNSRYSLLLFMDADGQFKIESINNLIKYISNYDIITGYRCKRKDPFFRIALGKIYTSLVSVLLGLNFKDINCGFKLFKKEVMQSHYRFNRGLFYTGVFLDAKSKGFRVKEIPVEHFPRLNGKQTGASPKVLSNAAVDIIKLIFLRLRESL
jgi:glycosyltransferase involved in cell wall biosynthesis